MNKNKSIELIGGLTGICYGAIICKTAFGNPSNTGICLVFGGILGFFILSKLIIVLAARTAGIFIALNRSRWDEWDETMEMKGQNITKYILIILFLSSFCALMLTCNSPYSSFHTSPTLG